MGKLLSQLAFLLSAVLSPYIVIPAGTLLIVYARSTPDKFLLWAGISIFFSTGVPALYVILEVLRGRITDVHVMEREQRGAPFVVAIISNVFSAGVLYSLHADKSVWGLSVVVFANGLILYFITLQYKISMHVSVLSAVVFAAVTLHPGFNPWYFLWLIPALMWARHRRGRHTIWQGLSGCAVAIFITAATLYGLGLGSRIPQFFERVTPPEIESQ